jgi:DNA-binding transcriptional LysR family regulator
MDFKQVRYFLALAETLNFTHAAKKCYVSQPALTQSIRRLEDELGGALIQRNGRNTELSHLGELLCGQFEKIDHARNMVRATAKAVVSGENSELNIGIMCTIGPRVLTQLLNNFQLENPMISLVFHDVTPKSIPNKIISGELDGAFCALHGPSHSQLRYIDLFDEKMVVAFPSGHKFSQMSKVSLREISSERYIDREKCEFRDDFINYFKGEQLELKVAFRSQREDWIQSMISDGVGVSVLPRFSLLNSELEYRPICDPLINRSVKFATFDQEVIPSILNMFCMHIDSHNWRVPE